VIFAPIWSPILTFSFYAGRAEKGGNFLSPAVVFTSYSLISLLNGPLSTLTLTLPVVAGGMAAFQRIQNFLNGSRRVDKRNMIDDGTGPIDKTEPEKVSMTIREKAPQVPGTITPPHSQDSQLLGSSPSLRSRQPLDEHLIASVQGKCRWTAEAEPVIDIAEFNVPRHKFTVVLGPVGCGKSTLLKSLLGELSSFEGTIRTAYSGVAYCDQIPWIPNDTVRNVIVGGGDFDEFWYYRVTKAAELYQDFSTWPRGDLTSTASKGLAMSGGQKQRLVRSNVQPDEDDRRAHI
jgi:ABC-type multidrug transport system fused ATPase/permease subunit